MTNDQPADVGTIGRGPREVLEHALSGSPMGFVPFTGRFDKEIRMGRAVTGCLEALSLGLTVGEALEVLANVQEIVGGNEGAND